MEWNAIELNTTDSIERSEYEKRGKVMEHNTVEYNGKGWARRGLD